MSPGEQNTIMFLIDSRFSDLNRRMDEEVKRNTDRHNDNLGSLLDIKEDVERVEHRTIQHGEQLKTLFKSFDDLIHVPTVDGVKTFRSELKYYLWAVGGTVALCYGFAKAMGWLK